MDAAAPFGATPAPFELLVVEVTDQGKRRPSKVARLVPAGQRVAVVELLAPRLVWFGGWKFVLSGTEEIVSDRGTLNFAQSWVCRLAAPANAIGFLARHTHDKGVELRHGAIFDRYCQKSKGQLAISCVHAQALGRHAVCADLFAPSVPDASSRSLLDTDLQWMSEERFALTGLCEWQPGVDQPPQLLRQGWLCEYDLAEPVEPVRKPKSVR
ncbi:hypothetical protein ASC94_09290 [Massilia sp. Root418]|nr:hypothetical protein ASC94_09290 [Massilia sp. Root418]